MPIIHQIQHLFDVIGYDSILIVRQIQSLGLPLTDDTTYHIAIAIKTCFLTTITFLPVFQLHRLKLNNQFVDWSAILAAVAINTTSVLHLGKIDAHHCLIQVFTMAITIMIFIVASRRRERIKLINTYNNSTKK